MIDHYKEIQKHMLCMLVRDFGYVSQPIYGHAPLRHQFAWMMATRGMTQEEINKEIQEDIERAKLGGELIPDPYNKVK